MGITHFIAGDRYQALLSFATILVILKLCKITTQITRSASTNTPSES